MRRQPQRHTDAPADATHRPSHSRSEPLLQQPLHHRYRHTRILEDSNKPAASDRRANLHGRRDRDGRLGVLNRRSLHLAVEGILLFRCTLCGASCILPSLCIAA